MSKIASISALSTTSQSAATYLPQEDVSGVTLQYKTGQLLVTAPYRMDFSIKSFDRFVLQVPRFAGVDPAEGGRPSGTDQG